MLIGEELQRKLDTRIVYCRADILGIKQSNLAFLKDLSLQNSLFKRWSKPIGKRKNVTAVNHVQKKER